MNIKMWKLIWFGAPFTKVIYAYLAYANQKDIDNSFQMLSLLILLIGLISCSISILLSKKIYQKSFYESKLVKNLVGTQKKCKIRSSFLSLYYVTWLSRICRFIWICAVPSYW